MKRILSVIISITATVASILFSSCSKDNDRENESDIDNVENVILIYAVNNSSLATNFVTDSIEMVSAMKSVDRKKSRLLVYRVNPDLISSGLYSVNPDNRGNYDFQLEKAYDMDIRATHPDRISEVIRDALDMYPLAVYDLIFWGHGTAWIFPTDKAQPSLAPVLKSYGGESGTEGDKHTYWTTIDDLATAVPDNTFRTIWFDCCYMSSIEVIYQFRNKCHTYIGYPTEVFDDGMNYSDILPRLFSPTPDYQAAARSFFDSYNDKGRQATVAVVNMDEIENLARITQEIFQNRDFLPVKSALTNYSREKTKLYDFSQYVTKIAERNYPGDAERLKLEFHNAFSKAVPMHLESAKDFNGRPLNNGETSGVTTHYYDGSENTQNNYYVTLDWYKAVY